MSILQSSNMNLPVPGVGSEFGPQYAIDINNCFTLIDTHDHSPGRGVPITPAGMNINVNLNFNDNAAINLSYTAFEPGSSPSSAFQSISSSPVSSINELFYTDNNGTVTQITTNGVVNAVAAAIPGESYAAGTFIWTQTQSSLPTTPANFDVGSIILRPNTANTAFGVTLAPPGGIASAYTLTLPLIPSSPQILQVDTSGTITPVAPGTSGQVLTSTGAGAPSFQNPAASTPLVPSVTSLLSTGAQTGYFFTVTSANATVGATYLNNGVTYTVLSTLAAGTSLFVSGTGTLTGSTLTKASGTGDNTITFSNSQNLATYTTPTGPAPLYLKIKMVAGGAGGGGGSRNASGGNGGVGLPSLFGANLLIANPGSGGGSGLVGSSATGGIGGAGISNSPAIKLVAVSGGNGTGGFLSEATTTTANGGSGGSSALGGNGGGGNSEAGAIPGIAGTSGQANTGGGGGGGTAAGAAGASGRGTSGGGGGAGGYVEAIIGTPSTTYFYSVGSGGAAGIGNSSGTDGSNGGSGGSGQIIVEAHFQ